MNRWICCQIGAREHYALPRALHGKQKLGGFYTDYWAGSMVRKLARTTDFDILRSLASRFHPSLGTASVSSHNAATLWREMRSRRQSGYGGSTTKFEAFIDTGRAFSRQVRDSLRFRRDLSQNKIVFGYDTGSLEVFEWCHEQGMQCVLGQMDPNRVEADLVREEEKAWHGWTTHQTQVPEEYFRRREKEWAVADRIVVNSEFCRMALLKQGVPVEKLTIIPLCYESQEVSHPSSEVQCRNHAERTRSGPLRVLFLGQVILRKGIQYLLEAARKLEGENVRFDVVGPIGIAANGAAPAAKNVFFHGRIGRDQANDWYRQADVFVLPTISDGFALTQLEAMAHGLPVVVTPCCGDVVSDGLDGFIVPPRDSEALAKSLGQYLADPDLLARQRVAALEKSKQFTLARLAENLLRLESDLRQTFRATSLDPGMSHV